MGEEIKTMEKKLNKKADQLLRIKELKRLYNRALELEKNKDFDKIYLVKELILRTGQGEEIEKLAKDYEKVISRKPRKEKEINQLINEQELMTQKVIQTIFNKALKMHKEKRLILKWPVDAKEEQEFLQVVSSNLYTKFRGVIQTGSFEEKEGEAWPFAVLSTKELKGKVSMQPDTEVIQDPFLTEQATAEMLASMRQKVMSLAKTGDLAADVFDSITAKWLKEAKHYDAMIEITANEILEARGLKPMLSGSGRRGGYKEDWRKEIQRQIDILSYTWITVDEMEVIRITEKGRRKKEKWRGESKALAVTSRFGQVRLDGSTDAYAWRVRPGDVFSKFLFGPGRQTALLSQKALEYDYYRQKYEKRLARYFAWIWRISSERTKEGVTVKTLLDAASMEMDKNRPHRTREKLEKVLDQLQQDDVITDWRYDEIDESLFNKRGWWREWLEHKILVTAPGVLLEQYREIQERKQLKKKENEKKNEKT